MTKITPSTFSYFDPASNEHHAFRDLKNVSGKRKAFIWAASILVGTVSFGLGGVALFRYLVGRVSKHPPKNEPHTTRQSTQQTYSSTFTDHSSTETSPPSSDPDSNPNSPPSTKRETPNPNIREPNPNRQSPPPTKGETPKPDIRGPNPNRQPPQPTKGETPKPSSPQSGKSQPTPSPVRQERPNRRSSTPVKKSPPEISYQDLCGQFQDKYSILGQFKSVEELEEQGNPLHFALVENDKELFKALVNAGADLNQTDPEGNTPVELLSEIMHQFYEAGQNQMSSFPLVDLILENKAPLSDKALLNIISLCPADKEEWLIGLIASKQNEGWKPKNPAAFFHAFLSNRQISDEKTLDFYGLFRSDIDLNAEDENKRTLIYKALDRRYGGLVKFFIDQGANLSHKDENDLNALDYFLNQLHHHQTDTNDPAPDHIFNIIDLLVLNGVLATTEGIKSLILYCPKEREDWLLEFLVNHEDKYDPVVIAHAFYDNPNLPTTFARLLIFENKRLVDEEDEKGRTLLFKAVERLNEAEVKNLVELGADPDHRSTNKQILTPRNLLQGKAEEQESRIANELILPDEEERLQLWAEIEQSLNKKK